MRHRRDVLPPNRDETRGTYRQLRTSQGTRWPSLELRSCYSAGGEANQAAGVPWRDWDLAQAHAGRQPLHYRTTTSRVRLSTARNLGGGHSYIFLLLVYMANLEPDVLLSQRVRRRVDDVLEALQYNHIRHPLWWGYTTLLSCGLPRGSGYTSTVACK